MSYLQMIKIVCVHEMIFLEERRHGLIISIQKKHLPQFLMSLMTTCISINMRNMLSSRKTSAFLSLSHRERENQLEFIRYGVILLRHQLLRWLSWVAFSRHTQEGGQADLMNPILDVGKCDEFFSTFPHCLFVHYELLISHSIHALRFSSINHDLGEAWSY